MGTLSYSRKLAVDAALRNGYLRYLQDFGWKAIERPVLRSICLYKETEDGHLLIAYQGTDGTLRDWLRNLVFVRRNGEHTGFRNEVSVTLNADLRKKIRDAKYIVVAGFSQGGGCAQILHRLLLRSGKGCEIITCGSPRALSRSVARRMQFSYHLRYVNGNDMVTKVPLGIMGFKHYGTLYPVNTGHNPIQSHYPARYREAVIEQKESENE